MAMIPLDAIAPHYGRARDRWPEAPTLVAHYETIDEAWKGTGQALVESVKSFLECICRTILEDYGQIQPPNAGTTELLVAALERLGVRNTRGASQFDKVLSAHNKLADALNDARNQEGAIAHGKDGFLDALANHHVRLHLLTGDTILSLLLGALDGSAPNLNHTREPYERFDHFNVSIDEAVTMDASSDGDDGTLLLSFHTASLKEGVELRVSPSRLLYCLDRPAYVEVLESLPRALELEPAAVPEAAVASAFSVAVAPPPEPTITKKYDGRFANLRDPLKQHLEAKGAPAKRLVGLVESLLATFEESSALDWTQRDTVRARVVVAFRRVLKRAGPKQPPPENLAPDLLRWFAEKAPRRDE